MVVCRKRRSLRERDVSRIGIATWMCESVLVRLSILFAGIIFLQIPCQAAVLELTISNEDYSIGSESIEIREQLVNRRPRKLHEWRGPSPGVCTFPRSSYNREMTEGCERYWQRSWNARERRFQSWNAAYNETTHQQFWECLQSCIGVYKNCKNVLYSAALGGYDIIHMPSTPSRTSEKIEDFCTILFTDAKTLQASAEAGLSLEKVEGCWDVVTLHTLPLPSSIPKTIRALKLLPHLFFPNAHKSVWMDMKFLPRYNYGDVYAKISNTTAPLAMLEHLKFPWNPLFEFEFVLRESRFDCSQIARQVQKYFVKGKWTCGLPKLPFRGLWPPSEQVVGFDAGIIYRSHRNKTVLALSTLWFHEVMRFSFRDQLSLQYVFDKVKIPIHTFVQKISVLTWKELFKVKAHANKSANAESQAVDCQRSRSFFVKHFRTRLLLLCFKYRASTFQQEPTLCKDYHHLLMEDGNASVDYLKFFPYMVHNLQGARPLPLLAPSHILNCKTLLESKAEGYLGKYAVLQGNAGERLALDIWIQILATGLFGNWMDERGLEEKTIQVIIMLVQDFQSDIACNQSYYTGKWVSFERSDWFRIRQSRVVRNCSLDCKNACLIQRDLSAGSSCRTLTSEKVLSDLRVQYKPAIPDLVSLLRVTCRGDDSGGEILQSYPLVVNGGFVIVHCIISVKICQARVTYYLQTQFNHSPSISVDTVGLYFWFRKPILEENFIHASRTYSEIQWGWLVQGVSTKEADWNKPSFGLIESLALKNFITTSLATSVCVSGPDAMVLALVLLGYTSTTVFLDKSAVLGEWKSMAAFQTLEDIFQKRIFSIPMQNIRDIDASSCSAFVLPYSSCKPNSLVDLVTDSRIEERKHFFFIGKRKLCGWKEEYGNLFAKGLVLHSQGGSEEANWSIAVAQEAPFSAEEVQIATTHCGADGNGFEELKVLLKSMLHYLAPGKKLVFHIITDSTARANVQRRFKEMTPTSNLEVNLLPAEYLEQGIRHFKACSMERLTLPRLLPNVSCLLYIDRDGLVLQDISSAYSSVCRQLRTSNKLIGMTPSGTPWYPISKHGPSRASVTYPAESGMQAGILAMNLKHLREAHFEESVLNLVNVIPFLHLGDQDLLNYYFAQNEGFLLRLECKYNTRFFASTLECDCVYQRSSHRMLCCDRGSLLDAVILHGNRRAFFQEGGELSKLWSQFYGSALTFEGVPL